jgi:hypothetical protein
VSAVSHGSLRLRPAARLLLLDPDERLLLFRFAHKDSASAEKLLGDPGALSTMEKPSNRRRSGSYGRRPACVSSASDRKSRSANSFSNSSAVSV